MTMQPIPVEEAQGRLAEVLASLVPGEEVVLTRDDRPAAIVRSITPFSPRAEDASRGVPGTLALQTMPVAHAQARLVEMVGKLSPEAEIVLTGNGKLIATIRSTRLTRRAPPRLGTMRGTVLSVAPDFDDVPEGFEEYLP
jgi:antitoxin (DNA-binding transcriptional repressor) of toxin-antitoxin stability system